jgi:hypothetical protein
MQAGRAYPSFAAVGIPRLARDPRLALALAADAIRMVEDRQVTEAGADERRASVDVLTGPSTVPTSQTAAVSSLET